MDNNVFQQPLYKLLFIFIGFSVLLYSTVLRAGDEQQPVDKDRALFAQALELSSQNKWAQAESVYRELLERNQNWPELGNNLAILLFKTNRIDEAKDMFEQAVSSSPAYRTTQSNRSQLYSYLASQAYAKALGEEGSGELPQLELIHEIHQPKIHQTVKIIEKEVEKLVIKNECEGQQPVFETPPVSECIEKETIVEQINQQLSGWSQAWSQGDFDAYIKNYSPDFLPSDSRKSYAEWKNIRRARLKFTRGVNVAIDKLTVFLQPQGNFALVEFIQNYSSNTYSDQVLKQVYMQSQVEGNWLILSERSIKIYQNSIDQVHAR